MSCTRLFSLFMAGAICASASAAPIWVPTNFGAGADAEVRESNFSQNRGGSTEIASRIADNFPAGDGNDGSDRNSLIYVKIDLSETVAVPAGGSAFRMTYRNNNLNQSRIQDYITPNSGFRTGMAFYGLAPGQTWDESTITYANAPGIDFPGDGNIGTRDLNSDLTFLGTATFPDIGTQNHLPIGGSLEFRSVNLDNFIQAALDAGEDEVTIVSHVAHDSSAFFKQFNNWINFNYLFNPKEQTTLNGDNYDPGDGSGNIGNLFGTDNSMGQFSPALLLEQIPEPTTAVLSLVGLAGVAAARRRS
ncbi:PEP-CTERM sorting domain-containing protein [Botrimarina sp.]|uniref:PEP-CTERM sorting domain-containing protein n=1 Tax=Botrimarina sp. TaxID=2795802 RepID=UPI0032EC8C8C